MPAWDLLASTAKMLGIHSMRSKALLMRVVFMVI
jgi:hypothetical protein